MSQFCLFEKAVLPELEQAHGEWLTEARLIARRLGLAKPEVTIDDVREIKPPPSGVDPRVMGAVFLRKEWEVIGYRKSTRSTCHNRPIGVFRLRGI